MEPLSLPFTLVMGFSTDEIDVGDTRKRWIRLMERNGIDWRSASDPTKQSNSANPIRPENLHDLARFLVGPSVGVPALCIDFIKVSDENPDEEHESNKAYSSKETKGKDTSDVKLKKSDSNSKQTTDDYQSNVSKNSNSNELSNQLSNSSGTTVIAITGSKKTTSANCDGIEVLNPSTLLRDMESQRVTMVRVMVNTEFLTSKEESSELHQSRVLWRSLSVGRGGLRADMLLGLTGKGKDAIPHYFSTRWETSRSSIDSNPISSGSNAYLLSSSTISSGSSSSNLGSQSGANLPGSLSNLVSTMNAEAKDGRPSLKEGFLGRHSKSTVLTGANLREAYVSSAMTGTNSASSMALRSTVTKDVRSISCHQLADVIYKSSIEFIGSYCGEVYDLYEAFVRQNASRASNNLWYVQQIQRRNPPVLLPPPPRIPTRPPTSSSPSTTTSPASIRLPTVPSSSVAVAFPDHVENYIDSSPPKSEEQIEEEKAAEQTAKVNKLFLQSCCYGDYFGVIACMSVGADLGYEDPLSGMNCLTYVIRNNYLHIMDVLCEKLWDMLEGYLDADLHSEKILNPKKIPFILDQALNGYSNHENFSRIFKGSNVQNPVLNRNGEPMINGANSSRGSSVGTGGDASWFRKAGVTQASSGTSGAAGMMNPRVAAGAAGVPRGNNGGVIGRRISTAGESLRQTGLQPNSPLHHAIAEDRIEALRLLLEFYPLINLNKVSQKSRTPLLDAVLVNQVPAVRMLGDTVWDFSQFTILEEDDVLSKRVKKLSTMKKIVQKAYENSETAIYTTTLESLFTATTAENENIFHLFARQGSVQLWDSLFECYVEKFTPASEQRMIMAKLLSSKDVFMNYPLHSFLNPGYNRCTARKSKGVEYIGLFLTSCSEDFDINAENLDGETIFHLACAHNDATFCKFLCARKEVFMTSLASTTEFENGENSSSIPKDGDTKKSSFTQASSQRQPPGSITTSMVREKTPDTIENDKRRQHKIEQLKSLLLKMKKNPVNRQGFTPLRRAVRDGFEPIVEFLVKEPGVRIDCCSSVKRNTTGTPSADGEAYTAEAYTAEAYGEDLNDMNSKSSERRQRTLIHEAVERCRWNMIPTLVQKGKVDINAVDAEGQTAFHFLCLPMNSSAYAMNEAIKQGIKTLLQYDRVKLSLETEDVWGKTPEDYLKEIMVISKKGREFECAKEALEMIEEWKIALERRIRRQKEGQVLGVSKGEVSGKIYKGCNDSKVNSTTEPQRDITHVITHVHKDKDGTPNSKVTTEPKKDITHVITHVDKDKDGTLNSKVTTEPKKDITHVTTQVTTHVDKDKGGIVDKDKDGIRASDISNGITHVHKYKDVEEKVNDGNAGILRNDDKSGILGMSPNTTCPNTMSPNTTCPNTMSPNTMSTIRSTILDKSESPREIGQMPNENGVNEKSHWTSRTLDDQPPDEPDRNEGEEENNKSKNMNMDYIEKLKDVPIGESIVGIQGFEKPNPTSKKVQGLPGLDLKKVQDEIQREIQPQNTFVAIPEGDHSILFNLFIKPLIKGWGCCVSRDKSMYALEYLQPEDHGYDGSQKGDSQLSNSNDGYQPYRSNQLYYQVQPQVPRFSGPYDPGNYKGQHPGASRLDSHDPSSPGVVTPGRSVLVSPGRSPRISPRRNDMSARDGNQSPRSMSARENASAKSSRKDLSSLSDIVSLSTNHDTKKVYPRKEVLPRRSSGSPLTPIDSPR